MSPKIAYLGPEDSVFQDLAPDGLDVKWVDNSFDPIQNKVDLINICGHYVLSDNAFVSKIKSLFPDIDLEIKTNIKNKLDNLFYG